MGHRFEHCAILSDLDGTFLTEHGHCPDANRAALAYFRSNGGVFSFATGRTIESLQSILPDAGSLCDFPSVLCNGAYLYDWVKGEPYDEVFLPDGAVYRLLYSLFQSFPEAGLRIVCGKNYYVPYMTEALLEESKTLPLVPYREMPFGQIPGNGWYKAVFCAPHAILNNVFCFLQSHPVEGITVHFSAPTLLEVQPSAGTKGVALQRLRCHSRLAGRTIYAIGNEENDESLLKAADRAAMPANGREALLKIPGILMVDSNDDGAIAGLVEAIDHQ